MANHTHTVFLAGILMMSLATASVTADPPRPGSEDNGLTENESATLWSRDTDTYSSQTAYRQRYGESRSVVHQIADGTDITFTRPPATAATWTRNDFTDLDGGNVDTAVHPPHADLSDGVFIKDAHATIFATHPSTRGHLETGKTPRYIAPNGTVRGLVDYRVRVPAESSSGNTVTEWALTEHDIEEVRLMNDGVPIATQDGSQTPAINYQIDDGWSATLTLEADIRVQLRKTTRIYHDDRVTTSITTQTESRTVTDAIDVEIYDLEAYPHYAEYPDGDAGVAVFQSRPWQGYTLTEDGDERVRGVWRFYTARNTDWDTLVRSTQSGTTTGDSDAIPVFVHAYPSQIGPRTEPVRNGPERIETWGTQRPSPNNTIGKHVTVDSVTQPYTTTHGVAVRTDDVDPDALQVTGIVRGVNASIVEPDGGSERQLRRSTLSVEVLEQTSSQATLRIELRDTQTGAPITLDESRLDPIGGSPRRGYITIADRRVKSNITGVAVVTIEEPGIYTARYQPGSWLDHNPAYVSDSATVRWHPLGTIDGWFALFVEFGWQLVPFVVMFYAGKHLLRLLTPTDSTQHRP